MLILATTSDKVQVITASAGSINVHASYLDNAAGAVSPGSKNTNIVTAATTDVVLAPGASIQRNVKTLHIRNLGGTANVVTVQVTDGTTTVQLHSQSLAPNATLQYIDEIGFVLGDFQERMGFLSLTANYSVAFADRGAIINVNGTFTLGLLPATAAGAGFVFRLRNTGMGTVTIDPNASETIDGKTTLPCCAKEEFLVACDGTNWITMARNSLVMISRGALAATNTDIVLPPDFTKFELETAQVVMNTTSGMSMVYSLDGATTWKTSASYYYQYEYATGSGVVAGAFLANTYIQLSAISSWSAPDFDGTLDLWPDPVPAILKTGMFHGFSRTTFQADGSSLLFSVGGWLLGFSNRVTNMRLAPFSGNVTSGQYTLRGQIP